MFQYEVRKNIFSVKSFFTYVLCLFPVCISFIFTYIDKMQLKADIIGEAKDVNLHYTKQLYEGTNAFSYILNFFASPDFYMVFLLVLLLSLGMNFGRREFELRNSGNGNMLFTRIDIWKGNVKIIMAQVLAANIVIITFFSIITLLMCILSPVKECELFNLTIPIETNSIWMCLCLEIEYILKLCVFVSGSIILNFVTSYFINNKYISGIFLAVVYIAPVFVCTIISGISTKIGTVLSCMVPDRYLFSAYNRYAVCQFSVIDEIVFPILYGLLIMGIARVYDKEVKKNYL